ncbi:secreted RxLR effector peptide protein, putative [Phytophthora infestans T30-4]|uniref:Secreted RxLR effector peptide protein n=2 Tax=Phytophthora infestans TaxID=4787 RepID=A0A8S9UAZ1_PHYIN
MRVVSTILLAVSASVLAITSGESTNDLAEAASIRLPQQGVAYVKSLRHLKKHDDELAIEERGIRTWIMAFLRNQDDMDAKAAEMIKGKTLEEAEKIFDDLADSIVPLFKDMKHKGITPETLQGHVKFRKLTKTKKSIYRSSIRSIGRSSRELKIR